MDLVIKDYFDRYRSQNELPPEIDGRVFTASHKSITPGEIVKVKVTKALPYDLIGYRV